MHIPEVPSSVPATPGGLANARQRDRRVCNIASSDEDADIDSISLPVSEDVLNHCNLRQWADASGRCRHSILWTLCTSLGDEERTRSAPGDQAHEQPPCVEEQEVHDPGMLRLPKGRPPLTGFRVWVCMVWVSCLNVGLWVLVFFFRKFGQNIKTLKLAKVGLAKVGHRCFLIRQEVARCQRVT